jgi:hypothetical protein
MPIEIYPIYPMSIDNRYVQLEKRHESATRLVLSLANLEADFNVAIQFPERDRIIKKALRSHLVTSDARQLYHSTKRMFNRYAAHICGHTLESDCQNTV